MQTKTGIGYSTKTDSFAAGKECSLNAIEEIDNSPISIVIIFCSGKYNPEQFLAGVRSNTGNAPVIGGAAFGVFTNTELSYEAYEATATVLSSDTIKFQTFSQADLNKDEYAAGIALSNKINAAAVNNAKGLLVFYDTAKSVNPPMLNFATPLFAAIEKIIDPAICCAGAGLMGDLQLTSCFQDRKSTRLNSSHS